MSVFLTSDLHFGHDKQFIFSPRGFATIEEHDEAIIRNWNTVVMPEDDVYVCGDLMLGDNEHGKSCLERLNGKLHICRGNHDTATRMEIYENLPNVVELKDVIRFRYEKIHFYCSHYPTLTANLEKESIYQCEVNLFGHTHQKDNFFYELPFCYHVGVDSHNCTPVLLDNIINDIKAKIEICKSFL